MIDRDFIFFHHSFDCANICCYGLSHGFFFGPSAKFYHKFLFGLKIDTLFVGLIYSITILTAKVL